MSTKINVRSPFYLNLTEPTVPLPLYDCAVANLTGFAVDNQGVITVPSLNFGLVYSYTSTAGDFANGKFASVSNDTSRTVDFTLTIPSGFSNSADLYHICSLTTTQAGTTTTIVDPAPCTPSVTTSGSIPNQTLDSDGATVDIDLSGYFIGETTYAVNNTSPLLITTAISGSTLTLTTNGVGGSATVYAIGRDDSYPTTCEAVQAISITVNATGVVWSCTFPTTALSNGAIAADGTLTNPQSAAVITAVKTGSCSGSAYVADPNNTGSDRSVTLYFDLTVPVGYDNAGATVCCSHTFIQPTVGVDPIFDCDIAALTGQRIAKDGSISLGTAANGTVNSFTAPSPPFGTVQTDTSRVVEYQVEIPSGYQNAGTEINCSKTIIQPATVSICGANEFHLTTGKRSPTDFCDSNYTAATLVLSTATTIANSLGAQICSRGAAFNGNNLYYGISPFVSSGFGNVGTDFYVVQISSSGIVMDVRLANCQAGGGAGDSIIL